MTAKKLLILGGKPIGASEMVMLAKEMGLYTIVADYLKEDESYAKQIADESWLCSTADLNELEKRALEASVDGVWAGVHEFNIEKAIQLADRLGLPQICTMDQWSVCTNKSMFKNMCRKHDISVTYEFNYEDCENIKFPVICKPADSSGSRGFSICNNMIELEVGYKHALKFSESKAVLIERYMPFDSVIIHYTFVDGKVIFSGMSDKRSMLLNGGGSVMALQTFPAKHLYEYISSVDVKVQRMFTELGIKDGVAWIEAFDDNGHFTFNEMGLRFGGSLTNYPVEYFTGIDQLKIIINKAIGNTCTVDQVPKQNVDRKYAILPLHLKAGKIDKIYGVAEVKAFDSVYAYVPVHFEGDEIQNWNSAQQVFCYIHVLFSTMKELKETINKITSSLHVLDEGKNEMLFCLYDVNKLYD